MKRCSTSSLLENCKSKLKWNITLHWSEWPLLKHLQTINARESLEKKEPSYTVGGNAYWYCHNVEQCGVSSVVVQSLLCLTLWDPRDCTMPGFLVLHYFLEFVQTHVHWVSHAIQSSHPLSPISASAVNLSQHQGLFQWVSSSHQVVTVWSFSFSIRPSNKYSRLISFRIDWLDPLPVQGTLKSLLQHHSLKASILWHSAFFVVQLSHSYMTTRKSIVLTIWTLLAKWCVCFLIC